MREENKDLHGSAPDQCEAALLLIDVINDLDFDEGPQLLEQALPMARKLAKLKKRLKKAGIPAIYVNDNFGKWQSNFHALLKHCLEDDVPGSELASMLIPDDDDYFVLKPKHSAFFSTTLDTLLRYLGARRLVLTGLATDICVLFTANDAYMRDFEIIVPSDCVAANNEEANEWALHHMETILKADVRPSAKVRTDALMKQR